MFVRPIRPIFRLASRSMATAKSRRLPNRYDNIPKRFIERNTQFIAKRAPRLPQYTQKIFRYKIDGYYDIWRPWEENFQRLNSETARVTKVFVEPKRDWSYFRGDRVEVIKGPEKGKQGIINYIVKERNWVFVQGLNLRRSVINKSSNNPGYIIAQEEPFLIDIEVKLVDPSDLEPTDFEWHYDDDGNRVRVSKRTERIIPIPESAYETIDYVDKNKYMEREKDTPAKLVNEVTFKPDSRTFEMDICDQMNIQEDRVPFPMYWY